MAWLSQKQIAMNNDAAGALYAAFLICLTVFWPSITLIVLVSTHAAIVVLLLACAYFDRISTSTTKGGSARSILDALGVDPDDGTRSSSLFMVLHCLGWHLQARNKMGTMVTFTHTIVLLLNLGAFLAVVHNESPPSSVLIPQEHTDHTRFGIVPGGHFSSMDDHSSLKLLQLAQRGYYYAEEYNGDIGTMPGKRCDGTDGIRCYAVGVRHFLDGHTSVFQPLPTPAYDVDVQVAVSMAAERNPAVGRCTSLEPIYTQQIIVNDTHQSEIFKLSPQPLVQLAWGTEADRPLCPWGHAGAEGHLGCMQKQRQTEEEYRALPLALEPYSPNVRVWCLQEEYRAALRLHCSQPGTVRVEHDEHGSKNHYEASYMRIAPEYPTVNELTGGVVHTILIMKNADATRPPLLRVTPKRLASGLAMHHILTPVGRIGWVHGEDANTFVKEERPAGQHAEIVFGQRYGDHAPVPALRGVSIPVDYLQSNYPRMLALYLIFFTVPLLISWNYCVVKSHDNGARVFPTTALLVRAPLLFVGFFVGSVFYAIAQGCIILAYTFVVPKGTSQGMPFAILILALGVLFNCLHAGFWIAQVTNHAHLMAFTRYAAEFSTGQIMSEGWSSSLATPLLVFFLSVEPISTAVIHFFAISYTLCCKTYSRGA